MNSGRDILCHGSSAKTARPLKWKDGLHIPPLASPRHVKTHSWSRPLRRSVLDSGAMRLFSLRLIVALIVGVTLVSVASAWYEVREAKDNLRMDLEHKVATFGESLVVTSEAHLQAGDRATLERILRPLSHRDHLLGVGIYDREDFPL